MPIYIFWSIFCSSSSSSSSRQGIGKNCLFRLQNLHPSLSGSAYRRVSFCLPKLEPHIFSESSSVVIYNLLISFFRSHSSLEDHVLYNCLQLFPLCCLLFQKILFLIKPSIWRSLSHYIKRVNVNLCKIRNELSFCIKIKKKLWRYYKGLTSFNLKLIKTI